MVDANTARASAQREIETGPQWNDPQFHAWRGAEAGEPQLVHDLFGRPDYWLVPIQHEGTSVGAVRVLANGRAAASIAYRAGSDLLSMDPQAVVERACSAMDQHRERAGAVLLVHDGPPGREAWRVEVLLDDQVLRWIFVTPGGVYHRSPSDDLQQQGDFD